MAKLSDHQSSSFTKVLYIGDSSTGKTGSLVSLVPDYDLRVLDMDNGLDVLKAFVKKECPERLDSIDFETVRDKFKATQQGVIIDGQPKAFVEAAKLMTKWSDESTPSEWGTKTIFVVDSLTALGKSAFEWAKGMNPTAKDPRQWYFSAQQAVENIVALLTSEAFHSNLIIISHVNYKEMPDGTVKGYANSIGSALGPTLPKYFNNLILSESSGSGENVKRKIRTLPTGLIDLKTAAPFALQKDLPLSSGMAEIFRMLKAN